MTVQQHVDLGRRALRAFERDLPRLWAERPGQWVAYQGERILGFATHKHELYQHCFNQGLSRDEFVIFCIEAQETESVSWSHVRGLRAERTGSATPAVPRWGDELQSRNPFVEK